MRVKIGRPNEERKTKELLAKLEQLKSSKKKASDNHGASTQRIRTGAEHKDCVVQFVLQIDCKTLYVVILSLLGRLIKLGSLHARKDHHGIALDAV